MEDQHKIIVQSAAQIAAKMVAKQGLWQTVSVILSIVIAVAGGVYFFDMSQEAQNERISAEQSTTNSICTSFDYFVDTMNQNMNNIGRALKAPVVESSPANPCQQSGYQPSMAVADTTNQ